MAEYIEREAVLEILRNKGAAWDAYQQVQSFPAADVRPVVTCVDCVYAYPYGLEFKCTKHSGRADKFGEDATYSEFHEESWFCADGVKREKN